jgi:hypothetical protein
MNAMECQNETGRAIVAIRLILLVLGLLHLANGAWMLASPEAWYAAVPGVTFTGPMNHHFIQDIGLAFAASGAGLIYGVRVGIAPAAFALAGATWPMLHALLHIWGWMAHGFARAADVAFSEIFGVVVIGLGGFAFAALNGRKQGVL